MKKTINILHEILGTTTKIALCVKIIAISLFVFCSWMCLNYFFQHYPDAEITSKPFDYNGMLVGFFTLLVTLLVGWNIYSTIRAKEELKETQKEIKDGFESRLKDLENKMEKLNNKQSKADGIEEAKEQIDKAIDLALPKDVLERVNLDIAKKGTKLYEWLWSIIDEAKTNGQILDDYAKALQKCRKRVLYINGREATESEVIELANEIRPIKLMILGAIKK